MAVLPKTLHNNPNLSSAGVGVIAAGGTYFILEAEPITAVGVGIGAAVITRGLIHLDSDATTSTFSNRHVTLARSDVDGVATISGTMKMPSQMADMAMAYVMDGAKALDEKAEQKAKAS